MTEPLQRLSRLDESKLDLLEKIFDHAPVALCILEEPEHRVYYLNQTFQRLVKSQSYSPGKPIRELWPEVNNRLNQETNLIEQLDQSYKTGEYSTINEFESTIYDRPSSDETGRKYVNLVLQPLKDPKGEVYGVVIVGIDITALVKARNRMADSEHRLKLALEGADMGFCEIDVRDQAVHFVSQECLGHFGHDAEEQFTYEHFYSVIHPEDRPGVEDRLNAALKEDGIFDIEYRVHLRDDSVRWILFRGKTTYDQQGRPNRIFGITVDITSRKQAEHMLREAIRLRDDFLAIASHELQTPVTSIKARTELLEEKARGNRDTGLAELADKVNQQVDQLTRLTQNLLDVTNIQEGRLKLDKQTFELGSLIEDRLELLNPATPHRMTVEGQPETRIHADRFRIGQVLTTLLSNAVKYSPEADRIIIRVVDRQQEVVVSVTDYGIGVPEQERGDIFKRFYKGQGNGHRTYPGLGLGLYIASQIIERHGGDIWVEDNPEGGSVFSFSLPVEASRSTQPPK